jgi:hypothetical protein
MSNSSDNVPRISWREKLVSNMPNRNSNNGDKFNNGDKVIQFKSGNVNQYITPNRFKRLANMNMGEAYRAHNNKFLFKNPVDQISGVRRQDIKFFILKQKPSNKVNR